MTGAPYASGAAWQIEEFARSRKAADAICEAYLSNLRRFDRMCSELFPGCGGLTQGMVDAWCERRESESANTCTSRCNPVVALVKFLRARGETDVVAPQLPRRTPAELVPHAFTEDELARLFSECDAYWNGYNRRDSLKRGKARDEEVEVKVVAMWSRKYAERARREREGVLEKSRQLVERPGAHTRATHYGAAQYVKGVTFDGKTGEVLEDPKVRPQIDRDAVDAAAALDGYYLVVTSETGWDEGRILDAYRELWRIEESFRVTKTGGLSSRPVWVWTEGHIRAHFLTCYLALLIVRLSQRALPSHPSAQALLAEMRALDCSYADDGWWLFDHRTDLTDETFSLVGEEAPRK